MGIIVVIVVALLFVLFVKSGKMGISQPLQTEKISQELEKVKQEEKNTYTVVAGDTLWDIAQKHYKSGYQWVSIAKANNLPNTDIIEINTKLILPTMTQAILATSTVADSQVLEETNSISGDKYTVIEGDYLWEIAIRAYGDGYKWPEIARANIVPNPDLIYPGDELKIPR